MCRISVCCCRPACQMRPWSVNGVGIKVPEIRNSRSTGSLSFAIAYLFLKRQLGDDVMLVRRVLPWAYKWNAIYRSMRVTESYTKAIKYSDKLVNSAFCHDNRATVAPLCGWRLTSLCAIATIKISHVLYSFLLKQQSVLVWITMTYTC